MLHYKMAYLLKEHSGIPCVIEYMTSRATACYMYYDHVTETRYRHHARISFPKLAIFTDLHYAHACAYDHG